MDMASQSELLRHRLLHSEQEFFSAVETSSLWTFDQRWSTLCDDFEQAFLTSTIDDSVISLARDTASNIATFANLFVDLDTEAYRIHSEMTEQVEELMAQLSLSDLAPERLSSPSLTKQNKKSPRGVATSTADRIPAYIAPAYQWLVDNIHDPYPSASMKRVFAQAADVTPRAIDEWFKSVRRHIGWVDLCNSHFDNKRSLAVAAAGRVFAGSPTTLSDTIVARFIGVKSKLDDLYHFERMAQELGPLNRRASRRKRSHFDTQTSPSSLSLSPRSRTPSLVFTSDSEDDDPLVDVHPNYPIHADDSTQPSRTEQTEHSPMKHTRSCLCDHGHNRVVTVAYPSSEPPLSSLPFSNLASDTILQCAGIPLFDLVPDDRVESSESQTEVATIAPHTILSHCTSPRKRRSSCSVVRNRPNKRLRTSSADPSLGISDPFPRTQMEVTSLGGCNDFTKTPDLDSIPNVQSTNPGHAQLLDAALHNIDIVHATHEDHGETVQFGHADFEADYTGDCGSKVPCLQGLDYAPSSASLLSPRPDHVTINANSRSIQGFLDDGSMWHPARLQTRGECPSPAVQLPPCPDEDLSSVGTSSNSASGLGGAMDSMAQSSIEAGRTLSQSLPTQSQNAAVIDGPWSSISDAEWEEFIRIISDGQEMDGSNPSFVLDPELFVGHELVTVPPADVAYNVMQGTIGPQIWQIPEQESLTLDFTDFFNL